MEDMKESIIILFASPLIAIAIGVELLLSNISGRKVYTFRGLIENAYLTVLNMGVDFLLRAVTLYLLTYFYQFHIVTWHYPALYWACLLLSEDFLYYWLHRFDHQCRVFWAVHVTHHSSEEFNLAVGFRSSVFQPVYRFIYFIPLPLLGFQATDIFIIYSITQLWGILVHTTMIDKLGWLEYVLVTPSHHRVHHGSNISYLDRNLGMIFIFWDKLFGTFTPEKEAVTYGLTKNITERGPANIVLHEWKAMLRDIIQAPDLRTRLKYIFGPPGWSHDGRSFTSDQLRKRFAMIDSDRHGNPDSIHETSEIKTTTASSHPASSSQL
jgi:sterol desaturase/sphingolipid hydroxylase (fatty acid hydroxylase superfamily)